MQEKIFLTGGAGFIGSNLARRLVEQGYQVIVYDNLILGKREFISDLEGGNLRFIKGDLLDLDSLISKMKGCDIVWHLAANSDISLGRSVSDIDFKNGTHATYNTLEAMRINKIHKIFFASSSAIYGEALTIPTPEEYGPLIPISLYGASKLASEGLITAFCHNFNMQCWIFRFGNVVGKNGTHGVILDFIKKLLHNPTILQVLGNGKQAKPYLEVGEVIDGMLFAYKHAQDQVNIFNLASDGACSVKKIAQIVIKAMNLKNVKIEYTGGVRGWPGDVPQVSLSTNKLAELGWEANLTSEQAIELAAHILVKQITKAR